jgi:photosystem II stability/assembly factor-like uncharacterized protein
MNPAGMDVPFQTVGSTRGFGGWVISLFFVALVLCVSPAAGAANGHMPVQPASDHATPSAFAAPLNAIICMSAQKCVAVGSSTAGITSDGGAHWAITPRLFSVQQLAALACPTTRTCIAVGWNLPPGTHLENRERGVILKTSDGGHDWMVVPGLPRKVGILSSVSCPTATFCIAVGEDPGRRFGVALVTDTAGQRWRTLSLPPGQEGLALVTCITAQTCIAQGAKETITGEPAAGHSINIITTSDGGRTWGQGMPSEGGPDGVGYPVQGMACPTPSRCFLVGDGIPVADGTFSGLIVTTTDEGATWEPQSIPPGTTILNAISCPSPTDCVVAGGGFNSRAGPAQDILTTSDGGQTWLSRPVPNEVTGLSGVSCPSVLICVAVGFGPTSTDAYADQSVVAVTTNGGATWTTRQ